MARWPGFASDGENCQLVRDHMGRVDEVDSVYTDYEAAFLEDLHDMPSPPHDLYAPFDYGGDSYWKNMSKLFIGVSSPAASLETQRKRRLTR